MPAFPLESHAQDFVRAFLNARDWAYVEQYETPSGRIDFCLMADGKPSLGIEVKRDIDDQTNASVLADYFEQAMGYSIDLGVPVVLAPVLYPIRNGFYSLHTGGAKLSAIAALTIFGGRANVGVFAFDSASPRSRACIDIRGQELYRYCAHTGADTFKKIDALKMVRSRNSIKVRG